MTTPTIYLPPLKKNYLQYFYWFIVGWYHIKTKH